MSKPERQSMVEELTAQIKASPTLFVTDFSGLNVLKMTEFRRQLRASGAQYVVVKNTLAQRALAANKIDALDNHLAGNTGLVFAGNDPMAAAKVIGEFAKVNEKPTVRAGWVDGKAVEPAYVKRLGRNPVARGLAFTAPRGLQRSSLPAGRSARCTSRTASAGRSGRRAGITWQRQ